MKVHLAGLSTKRYLIKDMLETNPQILRNVHVLESFFSIRNDSKFMSQRHHFGHFLLDSGAFSFLNSYKGNLDWDRYITDYADFINKYNVEHFFELDIDAIIGLERVEALRKRLESLTGRKSIPVWHKNRGKEGFIKMCEEYPYVAIGGIVIKEIPRKVYESAFPWFIKTAHDHGCKIHGLGYTDMEGVKKYRFDSVDSITWLCCGRGGYVDVFFPHEGRTRNVGREIQGRLKIREAIKFSFLEWVKFIMYADACL